MSAIVILVTVGAISCGMFYSWRRGLRSAGQATCTGNLSQIAFAMALYNDRHGYSPPPYLADDGGRPVHSWRVLLLETLAPELYAAYRFDEPWDGPNNRKLAGKMPSYYHCPNEGLTGPTKTTYLMVIGPDTIARPGAITTPADLRDSPAQTIVVAEVSARPVHWMEPRDLDLGGVGPDLRGRENAIVSGPDPLGPGFVFADLTVGRIAQSLMTPEFLHAL